MDIVSTPNTLKLYNIIFFKIKLYFRHTVEGKTILRFKRYTITITNIFLN